MSNKPGPLGNTDRLHKNNPDRSKEKLFATLTRGGDPVELHSCGNFLGKLSFKADRSLTYTDPKTGTEYELVDSDGINRASSNTGWTCTIGRATGNESTNQYEGGSYTSTNPHICLSSSDSRSSNISNYHIRVVALSGSPVQVIDISSNGVESIQGEEFSGDENKPSVTFTGMGKIKPYVPKEPGKSAGLPSDRLVTDAGAAGRGVGGWFSSFFGKK